MLKLVIDSHFDSGGHQIVYEDRTRAQEIVSASNLKLKVLAVADGAGGPNKGDRAAQTAIDAFFTYLERSRETEIVVLLAQAVHYANKAVFQIQHEIGGATATLTAAIITADNHLYVANVGNGRVYLIRHQKLTQLTLDHTYANVAPWSGKISAEEANRHPQANALSWKLGKKPEITVDLGFYVGTTDFNEANARKDNGLPLQTRDAVLVCSDGLVAENSKGQSLITEAEIIRTLHEKEGKTAAKELVSFALGRGAEDNISVALLQTPDPWRKLRGKRTLLTVTTISLLMIFGLIIGLTTFSKRARLTGEEVNALSVAQAQTSTAQANTNLAATRTALVIAAYTPTPTLTPSPTLPPFVPGQAGIILTENAPAFTTNQNLPASAPNLQLLIYHQENVSPPGYIFAFPGSMLRFDNVDDQSFQLSVTQGSQLFIETGSYTHAVINPVNASGLSLTLDQGCMSIDNAQTDTLLASCYAGMCKFNIFGGTSGEISDGQEMLLDTINLIVLTTETIPIKEAQAWVSQLPGGSAAYNCTARYVPTLTPTLLPIKPTNTQKTDQPSAPDNEPTQTPPLPPTNTPPSNLMTDTPRPNQTFTATTAPNVTPSYTPSPGPSPSPTNTATPPPTPSQPPTVTRIPSPTNTNLPPTPVPSVTPIPLNKCNDDPRHPHYCTPTPSP